MTAQTINIAPNWQASARILCMVMRDGTEEGKAAAEEEIIRMGELLDGLVEQMNKPQSEPQSEELNWAECSTVSEELRLSCISSGVPEGYETVIGYYARYNPWALKMELDKPEATLRDGYWLMHRANERRIKVVKVPAPELFVSQGIDMVNAYPLNLLRERMEG